MVDKEVEEFVALCASILSDGEVTEEEAYQLADWLNHHDEAAENWPGNQLVEPLREIWADGTVSPRELHRLARLLISVQREWARRPRTKITVLTSGALPRISTDQIDDVRLPTLHGRFRVPSQSEPGRFYEVNLNGPTCTCPDWRNRRSRLPVGDLTRCCKHILHIYARLVDPGAIDNWLVAFIQNGWPPHPEARWRLLDHDGAKALFCTASEQGWANVFATDGKRYERFGYNTLENRWAYGTEPEAAASISNAIASCRSEEPPAVFTYGPNVNAQLTLAPLRDRRYPWVLAAGLVTILLVAAALFAAHETRSAHANLIASPSPPVVTASPAPSVSTSLAVNRSPAVQSPSKPPTPPSAWTVITRENVKARARKGEILIPRGTTIRVIARSSRDLMISYKGESLTIPASTTTPSR